MIPGICGDYFAQSYPFVRSAYTRRMSAISYEPTNKDTFMLSPSNIVYAVLSPPNLLFCPFVQRTPFPAVDSPLVFLWKFCLQFFVNKFYTSVCIY
jgi:hypothetical protein